MTDMGQSSAFQELFSSPQFSLDQAQKNLVLLNELQRLTEFHREHSSDYRRILEAVGFSAAGKLADFPYLPVTLFKLHDLVSIEHEDVFKVMTSSGTTGQRPSRIFLDRETAELQSRALSSIIRAIVGPNRLPMLILDTPSVIRDRKSFSARGAGVMGMLPFGRHHLYALDDDMKVDFSNVEAFVEEHGGGPFLIFGFTFMVWKYFFQEIKDAGIKLELSNGILIHSGGWKKLQDEAVSNDVFKRTILDLTGLARVHNFYGMVEQVGSIFVEGTDGLLHAPNYAEVIVRDPKTWLPAEPGQPGVIEVLSVLPRSYPGHVLLTEDLGVIHEPSGDEPWQGTRFEVLGRIPKAELRGCSDTHGTN